MSLVRQSLRTRPPFGELGDPPFPNDGQVLFEEEYHRAPHAPHVRKPKKQEETVERKDTQRVLRTSSKKELTYADHVERLMIGYPEDKVVAHRVILCMKGKQGQVFEINASNIVNKASLKKQQRRRSWVSTSSTSSHRDNSPYDDNNDWFFEKILEKFEDIRARRAERPAKSPSPEVENRSTAHAVERVVERRYYVKKMPMKPKRDQLTSTTDLTASGKKSRLPSGLSSMTGTSSACSRCLSSTPTYIENLREQSESLRHDFSELKNDIEHLLTSQQDFFQQLEARIPLQTGAQTTAANSGRNQTNRNGTVPPISGERSRSISTESLTSATATTSGTTTPVPETTSKPPSATPQAPIAEFVATKSPLFIPAPPVTPYVASKPPSAAPTPPVNAPLTSKPPLATPRSPANPSPSSSNAPSTAPTSPAHPSLNNSRTPSIAPTSPANPSLNSKLTSVAPTPPNNSVVGALSSRPPVSGFAPSRRLSAKSTPSPSIDSRSSSVAPMPHRLPSPISLSRVSTQENELSHRRTLSPRSQIVASAASVLESSTSSTGSMSPLSTQSLSEYLPRVPLATLRDNELKELVRYSSQLELSGFPPSITPVITNPNTNSTFWDSVDHYIHTSRSANTVTALPSVQRAYYENTSGLNTNTTKQLEKYDLEIKPQGNITPTAPFLMPPLDTSS